MFEVKLYKIFSIWELLIFMLFIVLALLLALFYFNNSSLNEKGVKALKRKDFLTAQKYFQKNVASGFLDNRSYLNLALSYDFLNQPLKAFEIYKIVSDSKNKNMGSFFSYFNQAELKGRLGDLDGALKNYQSALEFGQKEKEIKTNIELLFKQEGKQGSEGERSNSKSQSEEDKKKEEGKGESEEDKKKEEGKGESEEDKKKEEGKGESEEDKKKEEGKGESEEGKKVDESQTGKEEQIVLTEREQKAILEEVQKQENKVRSRFYQNQRTFGDKTGKDW